MTFSKRSLGDSHSLYIVSKDKAAHPTVITKITTPGQKPRDLIGDKHDGEELRVACHPKAKDVLAAAVITRAGEFIVRYLTPSANDIWRVRRHYEPLDLKLDQKSGFCSVGFSEERALALDRRGHLLVTDFVYDGVKSTASSIISSVSNDSL